MDRFELEYVKTMVLPSYEIKNEDALLATINDIQDAFNFASVDVCEMLYNCPEILQYSHASIKRNLDENAKTFNLKSKELRYLFLKFPHLLLVESAVFKYKLTLLSTVFAVSKKEAINKIMIYPDLLYVGKIAITSSLKTLSSVLDEFGEGLRKIYSECPELLFYNEAHFKKLFSVMLYSFSFSMKEAQRIFKAVPTLMTKSDDELVDIFNFYYPKYFVKRDFKEMIPLCPEFLSLKPSEFETKIKEAKNIFSFSEKEACAFFRFCPNLLFYRSLSSKVDTLRRFSINIEYLKIHPSVFTAPIITIPLKFLLARILGLESEFEEICKMDTKTFISRFLFMQGMRKYTHKDLLLSEEDFEAEHHISTKALCASYVVSSKNLKNICEYYISLKERLPKWTDIDFPDISEVENYLKERLDIPHVQINYNSLREKYNLTYREYDLIKNLLSLHLGFGESLFIVTKCPYLAHSGYDSLVRSIDIFRKYGYHLEQVIRLLFDRPSIFAHNCIDLDELIKSNIEYYNFDIEQVVSTVL